MILKEDAADKALNEPLELLSSVFISPIDMSREVPSHTPHHSDTFEI